MKTKHAVIGQWPGVLSSLGIDPKYLVNTHGPCPVCGGKDRFRFDNKDDRGTFYCNHCGAGDGWKLLKLFHGWDFSVAAQKVDALLGPVPSIVKPMKKNPLPRLKQIASNLIDIVDCPSVEQYLTQRGLETIPTTLMAHPLLAYYHDRKKMGELPAMVARVVDSDNKPITFHCTYTYKGKKLKKYPARKIMPPIKSLNCGSAVRLYEPDETLGIAEGIETAIAAFQLHKIPTWAVLNTNGIRQFTPPKSCRHLVIFADNDSNYAGQSAAYELAKRLNPKLHVDVRIPERVDTDWADYVHPNEDYL